MTYALRRRLESSPIRVFAVHPGHISTEIFRGMADSAYWTGLISVAKAIGKPFAKLQSCLQYTKQLWIHKEELVSPMPMMLTIVNIYKQPCVKFNKHTEVFSPEKKNNLKTALAKRRPCYSYVDMLNLTLLHLLIMCFCLYVCFFFLGMLKSAAWGATTSLIVATSPSVIETQDCYYVPQGKVAQPYAKAK